VAGKEARSLQRSLADFLELPREIMLNLPRLTVVGTMQCLLENHRGVIEYTAGRIRISVTDGEIIITGDNLVIRTLAGEEIAVEGKISSVHYES
jgi:sporulation protein YqfC